MDWLQLNEETAANPALREMTPRVRMLFERIQERKYRKQKPFGGNLCVINAYTWERTTAYRRSLAVERILREMPIDIEEGDLIVGNCVENGVITRCALPRFLLKEEAGKESLRISHKAPNYALLLEKGLLELADEAVRSENGCEDARWLELAESMRREAHAVIALAGRYADLAHDRAQAYPEGSARRAELLEIARIARKVPAYGAQTFHEALQSIWFVNFAFTRTEAPLSLGCVDRIVQPYFEADYASGRITLERAQELIDCFCLRVNDRAQMDPKNYVADQKSLVGATEQSAMGYGTGFVSQAENDGADAINHWGQNLLIGGLGPDRQDMTSPITYMFLNAHEKFDMSAPVLTVRLHSGAPHTLVHRVAEVLKRGGGMPYIDNDDVLIPAYEKLGIPYEDACRYANSNCWETLIQGLSSQEMIRGVNFLYFIELALNNGKSFIYADQVARRKPLDPEDGATWPGYVCVGNDVVDGVDTGDADELDTFEAFMRAWKTQMDYMLKTSMAHVAQAVCTHGAMGPGTGMALVSLLELDCVKNRRDLTRLGARYTLWHLMAEAVSNAADAAAAIKRLVYEERRYTLGELRDMLKCDWRASGGNRLCSELQYAADKFGNDLDAVDEIAADMVEAFVQRSAYHAAAYAPQILFSPCIGTFSWIISIGRRLGASADGRRAQEAIAANMSPVPGSDVSGPTAALNSYLKLNTAAMAAGAPLDLRINSNGLEGEEGTRRIVGLIRAFLVRGGNMLTLTVTNVEELRKAMEDPLAYKGLRVRMGGWSAYFTLLSREAQEIHLRRVEHGLI